MQLLQCNIDERRSGLIGSLKFVALAVVVALAIVSSMWVVDLLSWEALAFVLTKIAALGAIAACAVLLIAVLLRSGGGAGDRT